MKRIIIILILTMCGKFLPAQDNTFFAPTPPKKVDEIRFIANYTLEFQQDSTNKEDIRFEEMLLFMGDSVSLFMSYNKNINDSLKNELSELKDIQSIINEYKNQMIPSRFQYYIYKNYPKNHITVIDYVMPDNFKYNEPLQLFDWKIKSDENDMILGYVIQKATTEFGGRKWEAWFAPQIPISDGPYKFNGLPGLIVKIKDAQNHYTFTLSSLEKTKQIRHIEIKKLNYIETNKIDFFKASENFRQNIILHAQEANMAVESQQRAAENMRRRNNPIELTCE